jgi:hypothetical protein
MENKNTKTYEYTYRLRGMSPYCQPGGFKDWKNLPGYKYEVISYNRKLTEKEILEYELTEV